VGRKTIAHSKRGWARTKKRTANPAGPVKKRENVCSRDPSRTHIGGGLTERRGAVPIIQRGSGKTTEGAGGKREREKILS